jgi:Fe-S-cluster containining protein
LGLSDPSPLTRVGKIMAPSPSGAADTITANVDLTVGAHRLRMGLSVPLGLIDAADLLPVARAITNAVVECATQDAAANGEQVSCKKGCGACCRQLVPIVPVEARQIRDLVETLPEPRRSEIRGRFAAARSRLQEAGLLDLLLEPENWPVERSEQLGLQYFSLGIPCPFLEEESCSIHADRPLACREYLVTSPAEECARPSRDKVRCLKLPLKVSGALARVSQDPNLPSRPWVPLIVATEWADRHPGMAPPSPGPELFRRFFEKVTGKDLPPPPPKP